MAKVLNNLKPQPLWDIFEDICSVPHPSKHEKKLAEFVIDFAKKNGIEATNDQVGNVILRKPATPGKENLKGVIMQSHLDMVPQKNSDVSHDFEKDPIKPRIEGEWIKATGTTLGADNGIGMAASLAVMAAKDIEHGPLECLITVDEETGMTGAFELKPGLLKGDILLNLDSEDHGELFIGCAGGINTAAKLPFKKEPADKSMASFNLVVKGLKGGHSGLDINLGRGNANKIINRILFEGANKYGLRVAEINGGTLRNAIPREAFATVAVPANQKDAFVKFTKEFEKTLKIELATTDKEVVVLLENTNLPDAVMDLQSQQKYLNAVYACPNGVFGMSADMPGLVETSNNLAIVKSENNNVCFETLQRSSIESQKEDVAAAVKSVFTLAGAEVVQSGSYPGWKPNVNSPILSTMKSVYNKLYGDNPKINAVHAGLECGLLGSVYPNLDMISFGPTIRSPHSPDERVNIESVGKFFDYLVETLKNI
ncbi:MAG: aminoacyl-histidine dipeptidase, partial [Bacteroidales bacterium]|nr:aminoacyl-histidine dipeptidase [Bacteroidales bacterium]